MTSNDKIIVCGPFVGSFFEEITNFRPLIQWISKNLIYDDIFIFSHFNRKFLYDDMIPIYEQYSMDDSRLKGHRNLDISGKLYSFISKSLKNDIIKNTEYQPKNIINIQNKYPKNKTKISLLNQSFNKIKVPVDIEKDIPKDTIAYIPDKSESKVKLNKILTHLQKTYNVIVIGDSNIYFKKLNCLNTEYMLLYSYKYIIHILSKVSAVICPLSDWTFLCNLQHIPVFSWGDNINPYKKGGIYNFNNKCNIISNTNSDNIISGIDYFLKEKVS